MTLWNILYSFETVKVRSEPRDHTRRSHSRVHGLQGIIMVGQLPPADVESLCRLSANCPRPTIAGYIHPNFWRALIPKHTEIANFPTQTSR